MFFWLYGGEQRTLIVFTSLKNQGGREMVYQHCDLEGVALDTPVGKVVCIGRNYADHATELGNAIPDNPILFAKPLGAVVPIHDTLALPF